MEIKNQREQLSNIDVSKDDASLQQVQNENKSFENNNCSIDNADISNEVELKNEQESMAQTEDESSLTKFKDRLSLDKAYVNLEREFTKKCQELKSLKEKTCDNTIVPQEQNLEQKFNQFLEQNPVAKQFAEELKQTVENTDKVDTNSLETAFEKVKAKHFRTNEEMLNDSDFVDNYVLKNSVITDKIVTNYLSTLASNQTMPLMSNFGGGNVMITPKSKPTSLKEAGDYVVALMNSK